MIAWDHGLIYDYVKKGKDVHRKHYKQIEALRQAETAVGRPREASNFIQKRLRLISCSLKF